MTFFTTAQRHCTITILQNKTGEEKEVKINKEKLKGAKVSVCLGPLYNSWLA